MTSLPRRRFLLQLAGLAPVPFLARRFHRLAVADFDPKALRALGMAVLPGELGPRGVERTVEGFQRWLTGYREGAELLHGYGTGEIRTAGPSPALRWGAQLQSLTNSARTKHQRPFEQLTLDQQRALLHDALARIRLTGNFLQFDRAPHVAIGLLGFFYSSSEATDLCYQARIGPNTCRPLELSSRKPLPLEGQS